MTTKENKFAIWKIGLFGLGVIAVATLGLVWGSSLFSKKEPADFGGSSHSEEDEEGGAKLVVVKTVKPRLDPGFTITVSQPCYVESYFRADLQARVAGPVLRVAKALGERVREGEVLVEIDVPDLVEAVAQKEKLISQRKVDVALARAKAAAARAGVAVAVEHIGVKEAEVDKALADRTLREKELVRFESLRRDQAIIPQYIEEAQSALMAARAGVRGAQSSVAKAKADWEETQANFLAAKADIDVKENLVDVAIKDRDHAQCMLELARIRAPFDGIVVERNVNPGSFVRDGTAGTTPPMMSVARLDMVTVYAKLPDDFADLVTANTQVSIQVDKRPGLLVQGKVTRFAPLLELKDRTLRVEVDLYNASWDRYQRFLASTVAERLSVLAATHPGEALMAGAWGCKHWKDETKGNADPFPAYPEVKGERGLENGYRLLPGMYGRMRLTLQNPSNSYLLPSSAVNTQGGKRFIMLVHDHVAHLQAVRVQFDDGNVAKVDLLSRLANVRGGSQEILEPLTGEEEVVLYGQSEVSEGQSVLTTLVQRW